MPSPTPSAASSASSASHNSNGVQNNNGNVGVDKNKSPNSSTGKGSPGTENVLPKFGKKKGLRGQKMFFRNSVKKIYFIEKYLTSSFT